MRVVTFNAGGCDGDVGIHRLKHLFGAAGGGTGTGIWSVRPCLHFFETTPLEFRARCIVLINRPLTDQAIADVRAGQFRDFARFSYQLDRSWQ